MIARGGQMGQRQAQAKEGSHQDSETQRQDELVQLADLREKGVISEAEFNEQKARILNLN
jgi:hypothetical protein